MMIRAGEETGVPGATPFLRIPDEQESTLQKATDIGALGLIAPTVDTPEQALAIAKYARYPPVARRSTGVAQAFSIYPDHYLQSFNDNVVTVVMIETPVGVANAFEIANVPGIDVVIVGNFVSSPADSIYYIYTPVHLADCMSYNCNASAVSAGPASLLRHCDGRSALHQDDRGHP
jgi:2-keto-3-deoxy-L-rhamnonate aldolase RhmA